MEVSVTQGIFTLLATLILLALVFVAIILLFSKQVRVIGLLLILLALSSAVSLAAFLSWKYESGSNGAELLWSSLLLPIFGISVSIALTLRYFNKYKSKRLNKVVKETIRNNSLLALKIIIITAIFTDLLSRMLGFQSPLIISLALSALIALFWDQIKSLLNA